MAKKTQEQRDAEALVKENKEKAEAARDKRNQASVSARDRIADNADAERQKTEPLEEIEEAPNPEEIDTGGDPQEHENEEGDAQALADAQAEEDAQDAARDAGADDARKNAAGVTEYRLTVNGKPKWQTLEQIRAAAQKVESADEYLQNAAATVTRAAAERPDPASVQADAEAVAADTKRREHLKDLIRRAALGDEEAIEEWAQIQDGLSRVTPDVLRIVDQRVDARVSGTNAFQGAVGWFEKEFATELKSPRMKAMAARLDKELAEKDPKLPPRERLQKVGEELREFRKELGAPAGDGQSQKQRRKETLPSIPNAGGRQREESSEEETESTTDTIARMAASRQGRSLTK